MSRLRPTPFVVCSGALAFASACAAGATEENLCRQAADVVEECTGERPTGCGPDRERYEDIIETYEAEGCEPFAGGKSDGWVCDLLGVWCDKEAPPALFPDPSLEPTRFPILLAHGFNTSTTNFWAFNGVDDDLEALGYEVVLGSVPPFDTPEIRAGFLEQQVRALIEDGAEKVNLVCFSMGGLDCRYLASPGGLDRGDWIASITTVSAPHRGSGIADAALRIIPESERIQNLIDELGTLWGQTFSDVADDSHLVAALESLSEERIPEWNQRIVDAPGVFYQSFAGFSHVGGQTLAGIERSIDEVCRDAQGRRRMFRHPETVDSMDALLAPGAGFVAHFDPLHPGEALPNDGVSTVESSKWGLFRGCFPADHLDQVGQVGDQGRDTGTGFDYLRFYRFIASDLGERGF